MFFGHSLMNLRSIKTRFYNGSLVGRTEGCLWTTCKLGMREYDADIGNAEPTNNGVL